MATAAAASTAHKSIPPPAILARITFSSRFPTLASGDHPAIHSSGPIVTVSSSDGHKSNELNLTTQVVASKGDNPLQNTTGLRRFCTNPVALSTFARECE